jgi:pimeloyl-ACP methyl ester carboxylesterase
MSTVSKEILQERQPFDVAWRTIGGLLARDAAVLRERLPHARLDVLEAGHCVWEERAPEFESIVTQWVRGGFRG